MFISDKAVLRTDTTPAIKIGNFKELKAVNHSNKPITLQASDNLVDWQNILSLPANTDGQTTSEHKYYRILATNKQQQLYIYFADALQTTAAKANTDKRANEQSDAFIKLQKQVTDLSTQLNQLKLDLQDSKEVFSYFHTEVHQKFTLMESALQELRA